MANGTTTTQQVDPEVSVYFDNILLDRHQPYYVHNYFGQQRRIPQKNSKSAIFRRFDNLSDALTPLSEGITPSAEQVTKFDITATVSQYGKVTELSDDVIITVQDQTSNEVADMLAQNNFSTYDKITRNMLVATASQIDCLSGANVSGTCTTISQADMERAVDYLEQNNGKKMSPNIEGTNEFGTAPVWAAYWMIISTDLRTDFKNLDNFLAVAEYPRQQSVLEAEFGSCDEVRLVKTTEAYKDTSSPPIYSNLMFAANGYGVIEIDDQSIEMIIKPLGAGQDALNQRQTMGWKGRFGGVILDDSWVINLRACRSA